MPNGENPAMTEAATKVLLVFPRFNPNSFWSLDAACAIQGAKAPTPPLGLITLAAMLPQSWQLRLIDQNTGTLTDADILGVDLVMTGGMMPQEPDTFRIIERCNRLGVPVAVGGPSATSTPEVYADADFVVSGEAEGIIHEFVAAWGRGERKGRFVAAKFKADVTKSPIPRFELLRFKDYMYVGVQFSRGCPFTCEFCDIIELYGRAPRTKTSAQMLAELDRLYELGHRGHVDFVDDNLIGNKKAVKAFLPDLIAWQKRMGYPFKFSTEASLNLADDRELMMAMKWANFISVFMGIETPDEETLKHTQKKQNTRRSIAESVHRIYEQGMNVHAGFIIGFDTEKGSVAGAMATCVSDTAIPMATISLLTALPNTQLQRRLAREGRLFDRDQRSLAKTGDSHSAGLNFRTLRPRRAIMQDYRDAMALSYTPQAYFDRTRRLGMMMNRKWFKEQKWSLPHALRDIRGFFRLSWAMTFRHPELAREYWYTFYITLRRKPAAIEQVMRNVAAYLHLYPFSKFVVARLDERIAELDAGRWEEPPLLPAANDEPCKAKPLAAVA